MASIRFDSLYFLSINCCDLSVAVGSYLYIYMKRTPNNYSNRYHFDVFCHVSGFDRFKTFNEAYDTKETEKIEINPKKP